MYSFVVSRCEDGEFRILRSVSGANNIKPDMGEGFAWHEHPEDFILMYNVRHLSFPWLTETDVLILK